MDISPGVGQAINAGGTLASIYMAQGAQKRAALQNIGKGVQDIGTAYKKRQEDQKHIAALQAYGAKLSEALKAKGGQSSLDDLAIWEDPRTATIALLDAQRQLGVTNAQEFDVKMRDEGWEHEDERSGIVGGAYDAKRDPRLGRVFAEREDADARERKRQEDLASQTARLTAPVTEYRPRDSSEYPGRSPAFPMFDDMKPTDRAPSPMEVMGRVGKGGYTQDALTTALGALPKEPGETPEQRTARIRAEAEARAAGTAAGTPARPQETPAEREARLEREAAARARGTAAGTPKAPEKPKPWTPMTREEQVQFAKDIAEARRGPAATNPDVLKRLRLAITDPQDAARWDMMVREQGSGLGGDAEDWDALVSEMQKKYGGGADAPVDDATKRAAREEAKKRGLIPK